ncbi:MAG: hypothetical protein ACYCWW_06865 [Deltaproteobacteria bacterium]
MASRTLLALILCGLSGLAQAQLSPRNEYLPDAVAGPRSIAMGDAFRAVGTSNDAIVLNPAALAITQRYEIDGFFGYAFSAPATYWNASIVDSTSTPVATGVSYTHLASGTTDERFSGSVLRLAFAVPLSEDIFIGLSGKWLNFGLADHADSITGDAALVIKPLEMLTLAAVGYNLIDVQSVLAPREVALAGAFGTDTSYNIAADIAANLSTPNLVFDYHLGGEYLLAGLLALRGGWMYDGLLDSHFLSGGVGLVTPGIGVDFAYRQQLGGWDDRLIMLDVKFFLPAS